MEYVQDRERQRAGIDVVVTTPEWKRIAVDEKLREKDYGDFLVELSHVYRDGHRTPGWSVDDKKRTDVIAYAIQERAVCVLLSYPHLRAATQRYQDRWVGLYGLRPRTENDGGYAMENVAVPWVELSAHVPLRMVRW